MFDRLRIKPKEVATRVGSVVTLVAALFGSQALTQEAQAKIQTLVPQFIIVEKDLNGSGFPSSDNPKISGAVVCIRVPALYGSDDCHTTDENGSALWYLDSDAQYSAELRKLPQGDFSNRDKVFVTYPGTPQWFEAEGFPRVYAPVTSK